jgi:putative peptidoglycan lipid II flippase
VASVTLLSRIGGLVREVIIGRIFGDKAVGSAFAFAFAIPNMFRRLLGEGALSAAFIPAYIEARRAGEGDAARLASLTIAALAAIASAITLVVEVVLLALLLLAPPTADRSLLLRLTMVMLPFMPLICIVAILAGMLQVHGRFAASSSGPLVLNTFMVVVGAYFLYTGQLAGRGVAYVLGVATVASAGTQLFWFLRLLRPYVNWTLKYREAVPRARAMFGKFIPVAIGMGTLQLNAFMDNLIATFALWYSPTLLGYAYPLDTGSNSILAAANRLYQFPLGVFGIAVATAAFPLLSRDAGNPAAFLHTLRRALRLSLFIGLPASVGLALVSRDVTAVMYSGGRTAFSAGGIARAGAVVVGFAPGIWAYSLTHVFTRAFYSLGDTRTPMKLAMCMVALNFVLNITLIWPLREAGLAWSTSISAMLQCVILAWLCRSLLRRSGGEAPLVDAETRGSVVRTIFSTAAMAGAVIGLLRLFPAPATWTAHATALGVAAGAGIVAFVGAAVVLRAPELKWLLHRGSA